VVFSKDWQGRLWTRALLLTPKIAAALRLAHLSDHAVKVEGHKEVGPDGSRHVPRQCTACAKVDLQVVTQAHTEETRPA